MKDYYGENGGVVIPNPNAPTSIAEGKEFIEDLLEHNRDCIVIIDEAYVDFGKYSCVELINKYDNLIEEARRNARNHIERIAYSMCGNSFSYSVKFSSESGGENNE